MNILRLTTPERRAGLAGTLLLALTLLAACSEATDSDESSGSRTTADITNTTEGARWYSTVQVEQGAGLFAQHCASCHGERAQGLADDWRVRQSDGAFPPPPLNGTAHAWHHPLQQLVQTIETGGIPYGGKMPPFNDVLNDQEKLAAIAYFQSFWNDEIYLAWFDRGGLD